MVLSTYCLEEFRWHYIFVRDFIKQEREQCLTAMPVPSHPPGVQISRMPELGLLRPRCRICGFKHKYCNNKTRLWANMRTHRSRDPRLSHWCQSSYGEITLVMDKFFVVVPFYVRESGDGPVEVQSFKFKLSDNTWIVDRRHWTSPGFNMKKKSELIISTRKGRMT